MKIKTTDLIGPALDWAVAKCEGSDPEIFKYGGMPALRFEYKLYAPSTNWAQGRPIIENKGLAIRVFAEHGAPDGGPYWIAERYPSVGHGSTPLIAAMRCYVASCLGDEVDVPDELV